jgi:hypothetical protein
VGLRYSVFPFPNRRMQLTTNSRFCQ